MHLKTRLITTAALAAVGSLGLVASAQDTDGPGGPADVRQSDVRQASPRSTVQQAAPRDTNVRPDSSIVQQGPAPDLKKEEQPAPVAPPPPAAVPAPAPAAPPPAVAPPPAPAPPPPAVVPPPAPAPPPPAVVPPPEVPEVPEAAAPAPVREARAGYRQARRLLPQTGGDPQSLMALGTGLMGLAITLRCRRLRRERR